MLCRLPLLCLLALGLAGRVGAQDIDLPSLAGRYTQPKMIDVPPDPGVEGPSVPDGLPGWVRIEVSDQLDIQPLAPDAAYVRAELTFANHHGCSVRDVMTVEAGALVLRSWNDIHNRRCVLRLRIGPERLTLQDDPVDGDWGCRILFCGARGSLDGESFPRASRTYPVPPPEPSLGSFEANASIERDDAIQAWRERTGRTRVPSPPGETAD
jgi:hypothetical protein